MQAVRENRYVVLAKDFEKGYKNNIKKDETEHEFYKWGEQCTLETFSQGLSSFILITFQP